MNPLRWRKMTWAILVFSGLMRACGKCGYDFAAALEPQGARSQPRAAT